MIFTVVKQNETHAEGTNEYSCEYKKDSKKLLGKNGKWKAEKNDEMESEKVQEALKPAKFKRVKIKIFTKGKGMKKKNTDKPDSLGSYEYDDDTIILGWIIYTGWRWRCILDEW